MVPCYRVRARVLEVLERIGPEVNLIFVVDDRCPEESGRLVQAQVSDRRVKVLFRESNGGVGAAMITGFRAALAAGATIVVKIDGDGQMDPKLIPRFIQPIERGRADFVKGTRFHTLHSAERMPLVRALGNAALSFMTKLSSGYWSTFDPTNGYFAVHAAALRAIDMKNLSPRFFFESDLLIKLGDVRAVVADLPMTAVYSGEKSNLSPFRVLFPFLGRHVYAFVRRIIYTYYLRDFNLASLSLLAGLPAFLFGVIFGALAWRQSNLTGIPATTGTVMVAVLPIVMGFQLLLFFFSYDIGNAPRQPVLTFSLPEQAPRADTHE